MKPNQFLVAFVSAAAITGGTLVSSIGAAQACPLQNKVKAFVSGSFTSSTFNTAKIAKIGGGSAILGGLIVGGVYLSRRSRQNKSANAEKAANYQALEFPSSLPPFNKVESNSK
ncbi:MAG: hypothetical protein ACHBN1_38025 [Heteroscytonema crispum UTEX LB 1556]